MDWKYFGTTAEAIADLRGGLPVYAAEQAEGSYQLNAMEVGPGEKTWPSSLAMK